MENVLKKYNGKDVVFSIPSNQNGIPVTEIEAKAFLSCKTIKKLVVPDTVKYIGDWAFAHMKNMEELVVPFQEITCGKKVFLDCEKLEKITISGGNAKEGISGFLASAVTVLGKESLFRPELAGDKKQQAVWLKEYDHTLMQFVGASDEEGFEPVFMGWFHVEDTDVQIPRYRKKRRTEKIHLILQRLLYPVCLEERDKEVLQSYLADHMPDGRCREEHTLVMDVMCEEESVYGNDVRYFGILKESGCLTEENVNILLERVKNRNPEVIAFLLQVNEGHEKGEMFFEGLEL